MLYIIKLLALLFHHQACIWICICIWIKTFAFALHIDTVVNASKFALAALSLVLVQTVQWRFFICTWPIEPHWNLELGLPTANMIWCNCFGNEQWTMHTKNNWQWTRHKPWITNWQSINNDNKPTMNNQSTNTKATNFINYNNGGH